MTRTDDFLYKKICWKAARSGLPGTSAFYYADLPVATRLSLESDIDSIGCGLPVLFFSTPAGAWTLVCTRQVIGFDQGAMTTCNLSVIDSLSPPGFENTSKSKLRIYRDDNHDKRTWHELIVTDKQGNQHLLHTSPGADLFALWNILRMTVKLLHQQPEQGA